MQDFFSSCSIGKGLLLTELPCLVSKLCTGFITNVIYFCCVALFRGRHTNISIMILCPYGVDHIGLVKKA